MKRYSYSIVLIFLLSLLITSPAFATATLHIGFGAGTTCATGCGGDPNVSGDGLSDTFSIYQNSGGASDIISPVYLIIGVPDTDDTTHPAGLFSDSSITGVTYYDDYTTLYPAGDSTVSSWSSLGWQGNLEYGMEVYDDVLGMPAPDYTLNNSNNWTNWHDTELAVNGIDAGFFGIYVFHIDTPLGAHDLLDITFASNTTVPLGSYVIAYGQGSHYGTPFTESGMQVPEPSTVLLLGVGMLGLWGLKRRFGFSSD